MTFSCIRGRTDHGQGEVFGDRCCLHVHTRPSLTQHVKSNQITCNSPVYLTKTVGRSWFGWHRRPLTELTPDALTFSTIPRDLDVTLTAQPLCSTTFLCWTHETHLLHFRYENIHALFGVLTRHFKLLTTVFYKNVILEVSFLEVFIDYGGRWIQSRSNSSSWLPCE